MNKQAKYYIRKLNLQPHPEGGYFREVYRSDEFVKKKSLPLHYEGDRNFSTSIYFLLEGKQKSRFHRLKSDEQWHFYDGVSVKIYILSEKGELNTFTLGRGISQGEVFQTVIRGNNWFAAELINKDSFCLVGCVVSPGFDFNDFELAKREVLLSKYPHYKDLILKFT